MLYFFMGLETAPFSNGTKGQFSDRRGDRLVNVEILQILLSKKSVVWVGA
jgi:hypothetical protein